MNIFGRSGDELVFDLIHRDNPDITPKLSGLNCYLSNGQVNTDSDAAQYNTKILVCARPGQGWSGKVWVKYNRINLGDLFKDVIPNVSVIGASTAPRSAHITQANTATAIRQKYLIDIKASEFPTTTNLPGSSTLTNTAIPVTLSFTGFNKAFNGSMLVNATARSSATKNITDYLVDPCILDAVIDQYPAVGAYPHPQHVFRKYDFSSIEAALTAQALAAVLTPATIAAIAGVLDCEFTDAVASASYPPTDESPYRAGKNVKAVAKNTTAALAATYPFVDTSYTHALVCQLIANPADGVAWNTTTHGVIRYFAFHYNKAV